MFRPAGWTVATDDTEPAVQPWTRACVKGLAKRNGCARAHHGLTAKYVDASPPVAEAATPQ